ncbi:TPA: GNAT family N-acetyltransferase [Morganella morganii]|nr:GNAT family N-acetyltransferase [Morganella morganii]
MIEIKNIKLENIKNNTLKQLAINSRCGRSTEYIAFFNNIESAFLSYEDWSDKSECFIYEIFVLPEYRMNGIGKTLIYFSEKKAKELGCHKVILRPDPFDKSISKEFLFSWYEKLGYNKTNINSDTMLKFII